VARVRGARGRPRVDRPDAEHVVVEQHFGLQADLDEDGDDLHVVGSVRVAVHAHGHEEVLRRPVQLRQKKNRFM